MFVEIYKCKMCGEKIKKAYVSDIIADIESLKERNENRHFCPKGDIGVMEFVGFRKIER